MQSVKSYTLEYQRQVVDLIQAIQKEFNITITLEEQPDLLNIRDFYQTGRGNFWLALDNNTVIGTVALLDIGNEQAALRKMFVHKDYRGKDIGVGQRLLKTLVDWARSKRLTSLYLGTTEVFKAAHRFYEKNGFIEVAKDDLPKSFPVMQVDTKFYRYDLDYSAKTAL